MKKSERAMLLYGFIETFIRENHFGPTHDEMCQGAKLKSKSNIGTYLEILSRKGLIGYIAGIPRAIWLPLDLSSFVMVPLLGSASAGYPIPMLDQYPDDVQRIPMPLCNLPNGIAPDSLFALKVDGDSMTGADILDGDIVYMVRQREPREGDVLAFKLDDGTLTLKLYYKNKDKIRLQPANPKYDALEIVEGNVDAYGKVVGKFRPY